MVARPLITVVDDDESVRESLPDLLKEYGFEAQTFSMTVQAMKGGAVEFLTKLDNEVLLSAIRHAIQRSAAVLDDQAEISALRNNYESLTPRERDVMKLVVAGMLNKQIGLKLDISEITVKAHRGKMMQKMKADSVAELVKTAVRLGLTPAKNPWHEAPGD